MYGRPQMQRSTPRQKIQLDVGALLACVAEDKAVRTLPLSLQRKESFDMVDDEKKVIVNPPAPLKVMARAMFKPDHPYKTRIGYIGTLVTSAAGVVNTVLMNTSISSASEWSAIDSLFDEFFIHAVHYHFEPRNIMGGGIGNLAVAAPNTYYPSGGAVVAFNSNCGLILVSLFNGASAYNNSSVMVPNPTKKIVHSSASWTYVWKNSVRFEPRGLALAGVGASFQGWSAIANAANIGGAAQVRATSDAVLGDGAHILTLGDLIVQYEVSFRARA